MNDKRELKEEEMEKFESGVNMDAKIKLMTKWWYESELEMGWQGTK